MKGWPRLSETFVAQEVLGLERRGFALELWSLRHPTDRVVHDLNRAVQAPVRYLPEYLHDEPWRVLRGWLRACRLKGHARTFAMFLRDLRRDRTRNRVRRFGQACVLAAELPADIAMIYAHFLHTPASVVRYAAAMRGLPFAVSAHAKDIWTTPAWDKAEKLADAGFCVTCTRAGAEHLAALAPAGRVELVHHGLDATRFPAPAVRPARDGSRADEPVRILAVARAVPKKGLDVLVEALALLPPALHWRFEHVGGGPLLPELKARAEALGIAPRLNWLGALAGDDVRAAYARADLFVLPVVVAADGDRDGLPNVLLEAGASELAIVSTSAASVGEYIVEDVTGRMVPPSDPVRLAEAMAGLIVDPSARRRLGDAARSAVLDRFGAAAGIDRIAARLRATLAAGPP